MKLLAVEDEHRLAQSLQKGLEQEHYTVDWAHTGREAVEMASSTIYDVIVLDVLLPELDGFGVCRELRSQNIQTPILMLTAKSQLHEKIAGLDAGADDYLTKPFSFEELLARLRALLRRPPTATEEVLTIDDLTLDSKQFIVRRQGHPIHLSNKEFVLLEYMMRRPQQTLTKQHMIDHVWNYESDVLPNTIEVYIRNLRKKIDVPFPHASTLIQTVRGFGYRLGKRK